MASEREAIEAAFRAGFDYGRDGSWTVGEAWDCSETKLRAETPPPVAPTGDLVADCGCSCGEDGIPAHEFECQPCPNAPAGDRCKRCDGARLVHGSDGYPVLCPICGPVAEGAQAGDFIAENAKNATAGDREAVAYPSSDAIHQWIRIAYREPQDRSQLDVARFTRWNMEVAFRAGVEWAKTPSLAQDAGCTVTTAQDVDLDEWRVVPVKIVPLEDGNG